MFLLLYTALPTTHPKTKENGLHKSAYAADGLHVTLKVHLSLIFIHEFPCMHTRCLVRQHTTREPCEQLL